MKNNNATTQLAKSYSKDHFRKLEITLKNQTKLIGFIIGYFYSEFDEDEIDIWSFVANDEAILTSYSEDDCQNIKSKNILQVYFFDNGQLINF